MVPEKRSQRKGCLLPGQESRCKQRFPYHNFLNIEIIIIVYQAKEKNGLTNCPVIAVKVFVTPFFTSCYKTLGCFLLAGCFVTHFLEEAPLDLLFTQVWIDTSEHIPEERPGAMPDMTKEEQ